MYIIQFNLAWYFAYWSSVILLLSMKTFFSLWVMLELNVVVFLSLLSISNYWFNSSVLMKYFLIQTLSSLILLLSVLLSSCEASWKIWGLLFFVSVTLKLGVSPFHSWFISISKQLSREVFFLMACIQKLGGFFLLNMTPFSFLVGLSIFLSSLVSFFGSLGQMNIMVLLSFSSVFNTSWFMGLMSFSSLFFYIFFIYTFSFYLTLSFQEKVYKSGYTENLFSESSFLEKMVFMLTFLNMGGVPPMLGFVVKLALLSYLGQIWGSVVVVFYVVSSVGFLFIYLNICVYMSLLSSSKKSFSTTSSASSVLKLGLLFMPLFCVW